MSHCSNHALDLILLEVRREVRLIVDTLKFVQRVSVVMRESSKHKALFQSLFSSEEVVCNQGRHATPKIEGAR